MVMQTQPRSLHAIEAHHLYPPSNTDTGPDANSTAVLSRRGERESQTLAALRSDLVENFKERMQLRRSLIDLQAQNIQNSLEVQKRQALLEELEDNGRGESPEADAARDDVEEFTRNSAKNEMMNMNIQVQEAGRQATVQAHATHSHTLYTPTHSLQARLADNERKAGLIRTELHSRITSEERKELLNLEYRIGLLELDNMELEHSRLLHEQVVQQRDLRAKQLVAQLGMRDKVTMAHWNTAAGRDHCMTHALQLATRQSCARRLLTTCEDTWWTPGWGTWWMRTPLQGWRTTHRRLR